VPKVRQTQIRSTLARPGREHIDRLAQVLKGIAIVISYSIADSNCPSPLEAETVQPVGPQAPQLLGKTNRVWALAICHSANDTSEKTKINLGETLQQNIPEMC